MDFKIQKAKDAATVTAAVALCKRPVLEPKYDGWRAIFVVRTAGVDVYSRTGKCYTGQVPEIQAEIAKLPVGTILDGELVAFSDRAGRIVNDCSRMSTVMATHTNGPKALKQKLARQGVAFVAFDCLSLSDGTIAGLGLAVRRAQLTKMLTAFGVDSALVYPSIQGPATEDAHQALVDAGMEGSIVKDLDAPYAFGKRGHGWFKIKSTETVDFIVTALPVDGEGQFVGQVGRMRLSQIRDGQIVERTKVNAPDNAQRLDMTIRPERYLGRVVEVKVYGWYDDGSPRHPTFGRWREDKLAIDCDWHEPASTLS